MVAVQKASAGAETKQLLAKHQLLPKMDAKASYAFTSLDQQFIGSMDELFFSDKDAWIVAIEFEASLGNKYASAEYRKNVLGIQTGPKGGSPNYCNDTFRVIPRCPGRLIGGGIKVK